MFAETYLKLNPLTTFPELQKLFNPVKNGVLKENDTDRTAQIGNTGWYIETGIWGKGKGKDEAKTYWKKLNDVIKDTGMKLEEC